MKLNKASQQTLTEIAKFLKLIGSEPPNGFNAEAKALSKALTQLRANIKEVESASAELATSTVAGQYTVKIDEEGQVTNLSLPEGMQPFVPVKTDESGHILNLPTTPAESAAAREQSEEVVVESGLGGAFTSAEAPLKAVDEYEVAIYVPEAQILPNAGLVGYRKEPFGNFTMPLYRKK